MTVLAERIEELIQKAIDETEAGWRPVAEAAWTERDAARAELQQERQQRREDQRRYARKLAMAASTARADAETIASLRAWALELEEKLGVPRSKAGA